MTKDHHCRRCCGPQDGPTREAAVVQVAETKVALEHLRHFLKPGDARLSMHLWVIHRADAWRHRHRAEAFADQLRAAGHAPKEPKIPPLPAPKDEDDRAVGRWFARAKTEDAA